MIISDKEWLKEKKGELKSVVDDLFYTIECKEKELVQFHRQNEQLIEYLKKEKKKHQEFTYEGDYDCIETENKNTIPIAGIGIKKNGKTVNLSKKDLEEQNAMMKCHICSLFDKLIEKIGGDSDGNI